MKSRAMEARETKRWARLCRALASRMRILGNDRLNTLAKITILLLCGRHI